MRSALRASCFAVVVSGFACGGNPPPPPAPPPVAPAPPVAAVAAPDLSEVPEPSRLVGILRWKNPEATLKTIFDWTGIRLSATELAAEGLDKNLAGALAFDAPVDAALALDERGGDALTPFAAVAVGVRSVDAARNAAQALGTVTETSPGTYKVNLRHKRRKSDRPFCVLSVAVGATPGRFVCGQHERDVEALRAYMTRTLPKRDFGSADLHVELRMAPVVDVYGDAIHQGLHMGAALAPRKLQIGEPAFDRAIDRLALGLSEELGSVVQDLDSITLDLNMAPDKAEASGTLRFKGQQSWTATTVASEATRSGPPPAMFWHLPATSTAAVYHYLPEARRFEVIRRTLGELVDGWLQHEGMAPADRAPIAGLFGEKFAFDSPWVMASGPFAAEAPPKTPTKTAAKSAPIDPLQATLAGSGWHLFGIGAPNAMPEFLKTLSSAANRPKVQAFVKGKLAALASGGELGQDGAKWLAGLTLKQAAVPKELPKGSLAFEVSIARDAAASDGTVTKKQPPAPVKVHLLVVPETAQTWIAVGSDRTQLAKTLLAATERAPESSTLGSRQDIAALRKSSFAGASFTTLEALLQSWSAPAKWLDSDVARGARDAQSVLTSTPNKGKTPIVSTNEVKASDGVTWTVRMEIPKAVIEDAAIVAASTGLSGLSRR